MYSVVKLLHSPRFSQAIEESGRCTVEARFVRPTLLPGEVSAFVKGGDVVMGVKTDGGAFKETVKGSISF